MKKTLVALALGTLALNSFGYITLIKGDGGYVSVKGFTSYTFKNESKNDFQDDGILKADEKTTKHELTFRLENTGKFFISEGNVVNYLLRFEKPWNSSTVDKKSWDSKAKKYNFETKKDHGKDRFGLRRTTITIETAEYGKVILGINGYKSLSDNTIFSDTAELVWGPRIATKYFIDEKDKDVRSITYLKSYQGYEFGISYSDNKDKTSLKNTRIWAGKVSFKPADKWTVYALVANKREVDEITYKKDGKDVKTGNTYTQWVATSFDVMAEYFDRNGLGFKVFAGYGTKTQHIVAQPLWNHTKHSGYALGMDVKYNVHKYFLPYAAVGLNTERKVAGTHAEKDSAWTTKETNYKTVVYNLGFSSLLWEGANSQSVKFITEYAHQVKHTSETKAKTVNKMFHSRLTYNF